MADAVEAVFTEVASGVGPVELLLVEVVVGVFALSFCFFLS